MKTNLKLEHFSNMGVDDGVCAGVRVRVCVCVCVGRDGGSWRRGIVG